MSLRNRVVKLERAVGPAAGRIDWHALATGDVAAFGASCGMTPEEAARLWGPAPEGDDPVEARIREIEARPPQPTSTGVKAVPDAAPAKRQSEEGDEYRP